jgi:hypothetical protein
MTASASDLASHTLSRGLLSRSGSPVSVTTTKPTQLVAVPDLLLPPAVVQALAVGVVAPVAGLALATSVAGVIQRNTVALRFSRCNSGDNVPQEQGPSPPLGAGVPRRGESMAVSENPTRLSLGDREGAMYRGAAVGNALLLAAVCVLIVPVVFGYSRCEAKPLAIGASLAKLRLPGRAFVALGILLQPTVTAAAGLLLLGPLSAGDAALSAVVLSALALLVAAPAWAVHRGCRQLVTARGVPLSGGAAGYIAGRRVTWVPRSLLPHTSSVENRGTWMLANSVAGAEQFSEQFNTLIGRVNSGVWREQFFLFGCLWSVITGVVGALDPDDFTSCRAAQVTMVAVPALSLVVLLAVRPFASPFDRNIIIVLELLGLLVAVLCVAGADEAAQRVSYGQMVLSACVSLTRLLLRAWIKKKEKTSNKNEVVQEPPLRMVSAHQERYEHLRAALLFECEEPLESDAAAGSSLNRLDRMYAVINDDNNYQLHGEPHVRSASSVRAAGEDMYRAALRYAGQQRPRSDAPPRTHHYCFIPPHVQQEHLLKLTIMAAQPTAGR